MLGTNIATLFNPSLQGSSGNQPVGAIPISNVLDNFNRANSTTTLGPNWTQFTRTVGGELGNQGILNNQAYNPTSDFQNYTGMMWNPTTFGPDCEEFITIATVPTMNNGDDGPSLDLRITNPGNSYNSYHFGVRGGPSGPVWNIGKAVNSTESDLATGAATITSGDKMWFRAIGSLLTAYWWNHSNSTWTQVLQVTDHTYDGVSGNIGFYIPGNNVDGRMDDFGGGNI